MITIDLRLFATLTKYIPEDSDCLKISDETTVEKLIKDIGIPKDLVKLIFINGRKQDKKYPLKNNDRVGLFPPVGGG